MVDYTSYLQFDQIHRATLFPYVVPQLLSLPNGIRLRELEYMFHSKQDLRQMMALVEECSNILEHVDIDDETHGKLWTFNFPYGTSP